MDEYQVFFRTYQQLAQAYRKIADINDEQESTDDFRIRRLRYRREDNGNMLEIVDIDPVCCLQERPVVQINVQDGLQTAGMDDYLYNCLLNMGCRVVFTKDAAYQDRDHEKAFSEQGLAYWKTNIATQSLCFSYIAENLPLKNLNVIGANGFGGCQLAALRYYDLACRSIFMINGIVDYSFIRQNQLWDIFFSNGLYAGYDEEMQARDPEIQQLNPFSLLRELKAQRKYCYSGAPLFEQGYFDERPFKSIKQAIQDLLQVIKDEQHVSV